MAKRKGPESQDEKPEDSFEDAVAEEQSATDREEEAQIEQAIAPFEAILRQWDEVLKGHSLESGALQGPDDEIAPVVTPIALEVSNALSSFIDTETPSGQKFLNDRLPLMKEGLFYELGVRFPGVRVRGYCSSLPENEYAIKLNEVPVAAGLLDPDKLLVNESKKRLKVMRVKGEATTNPANGLPACWIDIKHKELVEECGYTTWDVPGYMLLHLSSVLRENAYEFVHMDLIDDYLREIGPSWPKLVHQVCPTGISLLQLTDVAKRLVDEQISICNFKGILEALAEWSQVEKDPVMLTEYVRMSMKRYITHKYSRGNGALVVYLLDAEIEQAIEDSIEITPSMSYLALDPDLAQDILDAVRAEIGDLPATAQQPVLLTHVEIRRYVRQLVKLEFPQVAVLSFQELDQSMDIQPVARISLRRPTAEELHDELTLQTLKEARREHPQEEAEKPSLLGRILGLFSNLSPPQPQETQAQTPKETRASDDELPMEIPFAPQNHEAEEDSIEPESLKRAETSEEAEQAETSEEAKQVEESETLEAADESGESIKEALDPEEDELPEASAPELQEAKQAEASEEAKQAEASEEAEQAEASEEAKHAETSEDATGTEVELLAAPDGDEAGQEASEEEVSPYEEPWDYLHERLAWLKMQMLCCRGRKSQSSKSSWHLWRPSDLEALVPDALPRGESKAIEPAQLEVMETLKGHLERRIEARQRESHRAGIVLPLEDLKRTFQLDPFDEQLLLLALLWVFEPQCDTLHQLLGKSTRVGLPAPTIRLAMVLLTANPQEQMKLLHRFTPKAPLRKHQLLQMSGHFFEPIGQAPFEEQRFFLDPDILLSLTGDEEEARPEAERVLPLPGETLKELKLPEKVKDQLQDILARFLAEKGPGREEVEEEPLEQLYVFETSPSAHPSWQELFRHGMFLSIQSDQEPALLEPSKSTLATQLAASLRRQLQPLSLTAASELEELQRAFRKARLAKASLLIDGLPRWKSAQPLASWVALEEELSDFPGAVFALDWDEAFPALWKQKVVLVLESPKPSQWELRQPMGPRALRQVKKHGLEGLEEKLALRIVGHQSALQRISHVVRTAKAQLDARPERPDGVFLLAGPSGSGKTETAIALNDALYGTPETFLRLDMSEYHFRESVSSLIGTTPGWIGYEQGGRLTNFVRKHPDSVVLLDEIEKCHPLVLDVFLQVFDAGRLTDGQGETVELSRVTFLATTNIGAQVFHANKKVGFVKEIDREQNVEQVLNALRKSLRPEFLNRFDELLVFYPLEQSQMLQLCKRQLQQLQKRFARRGLWLELAPELVAHIVERSPKEKGARGIQRTLERMVSQPLISLLLEHPELQHLTVSIKAGEIAVERGNAPGKTARSL